MYIIPKSRTSKASRSAISSDIVPVISLFSTFRSFKDTRPPTSSGIGPVSELFAVRKYREQTQTNINLDKHYKCTVLPINDTNTGKYRCIYIYELTYLNSYIPEKKDSRKL